MLALAVAAVAFAPVQQWLWFEDRLSEHPPTLLVTLAGEGEQRCVAREDTLVIEYLEGRVFGAHPQLSIDLADRNRVLLGFDLEPRGAVTSAALELSLRQSANGTTAPFDLAVHAVTGAWSEATTTWKGQPTFTAEPGALGMIGPKAGTVTIDVTALVRGWSTSDDARRGFMLRVAAPVPTIGPGERSDLDAALLAAVDWETDVSLALERARELKRPLFVAVVAEFGQSALCDHLRLLLATSLSHPDVRGALAERFVPTLVRVSPNVVTSATTAGGASPTPLAALGVTLADALPPALLVFDQTGHMRGARASLGAFDHLDVLALLGAQPTDPGAALKRALAALRGGDFSGAETSFAALAGQPQADYWRAALVARRGDRARAAALLSALESRAPESPWALKARARRVLPDIVEHYEALSRPTLAKGESEQVAAALELLVSLQLPDGSFPMGATPFEEQRIGITAMCAHALHLHGRRAEAGRAHTWLAQTFGALPAERVNSFAAAYWLDYTLARHASDSAQSGEVRAAIDLLAAGQMSNGAWSYSKQWGEGWRGGIGGWPATTEGRAHSVNTGQALEVLARARDAGFEVEPAVLERGRDALLAMRRAPAQFTYTWPEPVNFMDLESNVARAPLCEAALRRLDANEPADLASALAQLETGLTHLRAPGKATDSWLPPHGLSAYFRGYAWYHGVLAAKLRGGVDAQRLVKRIRAEVLDSLEADGTWLDSYTFGKAHGTAAALLVLAHAH